VAGLFVHERHHAANLPRFAGWWGHNKDTRFKMPPGYEPIPTAEAWQHSNAPILSMAALRASLDLFVEAGMEQIRAKGLKLSAFARLCISEAIAEAGLDMRIITPEGEAERGCQLSLQTGPDGKAHFERLTAAGIIADWREPDVIRIAPVALYNSFEDVWRFAATLKGA
jgi:kynureninase